MTDSLDAGLAARFAQLAVKFDVLAAVARDLSQNPDGLAEEAPEHVLQAARDAFTARPDCGHGHRLEAL